MVRGCHEVRSILVALTIVVGFKETGGDLLDLIKGRLGLDFGHVFTLVLSAVEQVVISVVGVLLSGLFLGFLRPLIVPHPRVSALPADFSPLEGFPDAAALATSVRLLCAAVLSCRAAVFSFMAASSSALWSSRDMGLFMLSLGFCSEANRASPSMSNGYIS